MSCCRVELGCSAWFHVMTRLRHQAVGRQGDTATWIMDRGLQLAVEAHQGEAELVTPCEQWAVVTSCGPLWWSPSAKPCAPGGVLAWLCRNNKVFAA